jgi:hypothetical protein
MNEPDPGSATTTPVFVEDVFVTNVFLIKGRLHGKGKRLTNTLEDWPRTFLHVRDATMVALRSKEVIRTPNVMVNLQELLFAHELLEIAGDEGMRRLGKSEKTTRIRGFFGGSMQFELAGQVEPGAYESTQFAPRRFFIMKEPKVRGLDLDHPELQLLAKLDYAIVRKDRMAYVYDFS